MNQSPIMHRTRLFLISTFLLFAQIMWGQTDSVQVKIKVEGKIRQENDQSISTVIVVNQSTKKGVFGKSDGSFSLECLKTDTLSFTSLGYHSRTVCFKDSVMRENYNIVLYLEERIATLNVVEVFAPRDLEAIQKDIEKLGYNEDDYMLSGLNAMASPITFLYQQFSKVEKSKRLVKEMENEDQKRSLLKELFHHYIAYDIIDLSDEEFDAFIDYINVSDEFIKSSSQYDFLIFVRDKYKDYKKIQRQTNFKESDYNFEED